MKIIVYVFVVASALAFLGCSKTNNTTSSTDRASHEKLRGTIKTNDEMLSHFQKYKTDLDTLSLWIAQDKLEFLQFKGFDKHHLDRISKEREEAYFALMEKANIKLIARGNALKFNSIILYLPEVNSQDGELQQGYEYKNNISKENKNWVEVDGELVEEARKQAKNTFVFKPIEEHWSMICLIQ